MHSKFSSFIATCQEVALYTVQTISKRFKGFGFGLYIGRQITDAHNGELRYKAGKIKPLLLFLHS
jgi:K+-sensing histidine kinase KdpD